VRPVNEVSFPIAFVAGLVSFLSPCVLPIVPAYLSIITGLTHEELIAGRKPSKVLASTLCFIAGFSVVFIALGASSSYLGALLIRHHDVVRIGGGILVIIFGLFTAGFIKGEMLMRHHRVPLPESPAGLIGAFLMGMGFSAGWTPCIGPILGSILIFAGSEGETGKGIALLAVYSLGLAVPFLIASFAVATFLSHARRMQRYLNKLSLISGIVLIIFGVLLVTDLLTHLTALFPEISFGL
jgi:cytochrome c-type biogenesis protein